MEYKFPKIRHLDDIRDAIEGCSDFIIAEKDGYQVVNYVVRTPDTFPLIPEYNPLWAHVDGLAEPYRTQHENFYNATIRRECRGLVFDEDGWLISRRYHKFFNVGENDEVQLDKIDFNQSHVVLEKLDGSMISPIPLNGGYRWTTKMGITEIAMQVEEFVAKNVRYSDFAEFMDNNDLTPIFEWCSRKNKIVIDHPIDQLILTAIRHNCTGEYHAYPRMRFIGEVWNIPVVEAFQVGGGKDWLQAANAMEGKEGIVIRFETGHMVKVKSEWYVLRHTNKDAITREKNVISYLVNEQLDDIYPYLTQEDKNRINNFSNAFWSEIVYISNELEDAYKEIRAKFKWDRKAFALEWAPTLPRLTAAFFFRMWDGSLARDAIVDHIKKNCGAQSKIDSVRWLFGNLKWEYGEFDDET
jgi:T4 RnlA family RNA ligase